MASRNRIFSKLPVQGMINCVWEHLVYPAFMMTWWIRFFEEAMLVWWGLTPASNRSTTSSCSDAHDWCEANSDASAPIIWSILLAGVIRDVVDMGWWFYAHWCKWRGHRKDWQE